MNRLSQNCRRLFVPVAAVIAGISFAGCGQSGPVLYPVSGTVTVEGQPLDKAGVAFQPDESKGNTLGLFPAGTTDASGKYELMTASKKGAPAGHYKIVIIPYSPPPFGGDVPKAAAIAFDKKFSSPNTTELSFEVAKNSKPLVFDIKLTK